MNQLDNEQTGLLREILKWIRFAGMKEVKGTLLSALDTDQKKIVYQLSDGRKGMVEVAKAAGISSTSTISKYWRSWSILSLGDYVAVKGGDRFKRAFDLEDLGIEVPPSKENAKEVKQSTESTAAENAAVTLEQSSEEEHA
jgi:hypothetical protein